MSRRPATSFNDVLGEHGYVNVRCRDCRREAQFELSAVVALFQQERWTDHYREWGRRFTCQPPPFGCGARWPKVSFATGDPPMGYAPLFVRRRQIKEPRV